MKPEKKSALLHDDSFWIENILRNLNHKDPIGREEIRRLVAAWDGAGRDIGETLKDLPELGPYLLDSAGWPSWRLVLVPTGSGFQYWPVEPEVKVRPLTERNEKRDQACLMFLHFLFTEQRDSLAGPCKREKCAKYWIRKRTKSGNYRKRTLYCSRRCQQNDAAAKNTKDRRNDAHNEKLRVAADLAEKWTTARTKDDWKQWVSKQPAGVKAEITPKFLTRAVNDYGLVEPTKGR